MKKEYLNSSISEIVEKFLEFENKSSVLNYHYQYRNMLIWPFVRIVVLNSIIKNYANMENVQVDIVSQKRKKCKLFSYKWTQILKLKENSVFCRKQKDIIFLYGAGSNIKDNTGKYYNRIYDDFVEMHKNTAIIETAPLFQHFYPKKYETYESDSLDIICMFSEKFVNLNKADKTTIDMFIDCLKLELPFQLSDDDWRAVRFELERYAKNNKLIYRFYEKSFRNMHPKLVFIEEGCYGNHAACKIKVLKDLGIPCAEIQHGLVGLSHFAYNYSNAIYESKEYKEYMPDVFLTMGKYWMECVRVPVKMEVLGSANFSRNRQAMSNEREEEGILVLPVETQPYLELVTFLRKNLPDKKIIVKIHPLYRKQYEMFKEIEASNLKVYIDGNIYDYLEQVNVVIGDCSTVLYEAAAIKKAVMVWRNEMSIAYTDSKLGYWFDDKYELLELLKEPLSLENKDMIAPEDIFEYDIKTKYLDFIKKNLDNMK